jgi:hypothetical protein
LTNATYSINKAILKKKNKKAKNFID